ncbi:MAG: hypothetical protein BWK80_60745 [Desulfobacteraceae bacterium IS3]|nr:MAG: hypothetical protein BWK80_60745 [Desulfobacteraceae bacterium IS3]
MGKHFDIASLITIFVTFVLFIMALFTKGFTHNLLLETGVFLVSVKLIIMAYKNNMSNKEIIKELHDIKQIIGKNRK